ncbi:HD domain-containing phosphohydrolase [Thermogutta sp.]|uniref:HD-GYP domain-containing protein n=1 Tax=Thermogutta sp. TaxID=1962930 RepID=UPI00321FDCE5
MSVEITPKTDAGFLSFKPRVFVASGLDDELSTLIKDLKDEFEVIVQPIEEAQLHTIAQSNPDVVLLAATERCFDLSRKIKDGPIGPFTQVIIVGKPDTIATPEQFCESQADDFIKLPLSCDCLRLKLWAQVRLQQRLRAAVERVWTLNAEIQRINQELEVLAEIRFQEIIEVRDLAIFALAKLAESRDPETGEHLERMRWYSRIIAEELFAGPVRNEDMSPRFAEEIFRSAPLHDIGKVGIPDSILLKPGRLTPQEFEVMKQHTIIGYQALQEALKKNPAGSFLARAAEIARSHHERFDGTGYPDGLAGKSIPLAARVVTVADVFDALTSPRVYKKAIDPHFAKSIILREAGTQFDPEIVAAFERRWKDICAVGEPYWRQIPEERLERSFAEFKGIVGQSFTTETVLLTRQAVPC